jgi:predicted transcriptional regulator
MSTRSVTLRLDAEAAERLDRAARATRRPRTRILREALERHLDVLTSTESAEVQANDQEVTADASRPTEAVGQRLIGYDKILSLIGAGRGIDGGRSAEDIDHAIEWLRSDDVDR